LALLLGDHTALGGEMEILFFYQFRDAGAYVGYRRLLGWFIVRYDEHTGHPYSEDFGLSFDELAGEVETILEVI
jgi:hypothetical protein